MNVFGIASNLSVFLVRAGSTDLDDQGRIVGSLDMPLSPAGEAEARQTAIDLQEADFDVIVSAHCLAAQQTAQQLSRNSEIRVRVEEGWLNLNHGLWHGKSLEELKETQPKLYRHWRENPETVCPPGGETVEEVRIRVSNSLKKIHRKFQGGTIAIVAPEPLLSIIRAEIDDSTVRDPIQPNCGEKRWEEIEMRTKAIA